MSRLLKPLALALATVTVLTGCASTSTPSQTPDRIACETWAQGEKQMLQMVSLIATLAQKPEGLTNDALSQFNGARNTLLAAYDSATKAAESSAIKDALAAALDADSVVYYDIAGATQDRMQKSITAVSSVITACGASGIDLASIFNAKQ